MLSCTKEKVFENDVEGFDNIQKERGRVGREKGYSNWQEGDREIARDKDTQDGTRQQADRYGPG